MGSPERSQIVSRKRKITNDTVYGSNTDQGLTVLGDVAGVVVSGLLLVEGYLSEVLP
jgi:hypothetical protein